MNRADKLVSVTVLGILPPVCLMLIFWWGSIPFAGERGGLILSLALTGLAAGIVLDCTVLRRFLFSLFSFSIPALLIIEFLYSVLVYGFFMGFPVFNSLVGILAAYLIARRAALLQESPSKARPEISLVIVFSTVLLFLFCLCSAFLALSEESIGSQVQGMMRLPFAPDRAMVWGIILAGGAGLLLFQVSVSRLVVARVSPKE